MGTGRAVKDRRRSGRPADPRSIAAHPMHNGAPISLDDWAEAKLAAARAEIDTRKLRTKNEPPPPLPRRTLWLAVAALFMCLVLALVAATAHRWIGGW